MRQRTSYIRSSRNRRAYTLVVFAMLMFAFFGFAALVIDIGFARLAQRQMKSAVDTAALEGLRGRDNDGVADPDTTRRLTASEFVALTFDDDLLPSAGDTRNFGAGPVVTLTGGAGDPNLNASQLLTIPATPVYKPRRSDGQPGLELNLGNIVHGDLVAGSFDLTASHQEANNYARIDFDTTATTPNAFLARMRRTNDFLGLDALPGISSAGPNVPILFGRGSLIGPADPASGFSRRHHGLTVRATSIAMARRAKSIGQSNQANNLAGALPFVLHRSPWENDLGSTAVTIEVNASGQLLVGTNVVGYVQHADGIGRRSSLGAEAIQETVNDPATYVSQLLSNLPSSGLGYAVIAPNSTGTTIPNRVIGFGLLVDIAADTGNPTRFVVRREIGRIALENASGVTTMALDLLFRDELNDPHFAELIQQHNQLTGSLLTPVLVR